MFLILFFFSVPIFLRFYFFFNDTATTEIYTLSLHDALPISYLRVCGVSAGNGDASSDHRRLRLLANQIGRARLNSSHLGISYAVFCLKKKKNGNVDVHRRLQQGFMPQDLTSELACFGLVLVC